MANTQSENTSSSVAVDRTSKPLYIKNSDLKTSQGKHLTDYDLIDPIKKVIGDDILCVQLDRNLWRVYLKNVESRIKLLTRGIEINGVSFQFYDSNPYATGANSTDQKALKIRICGLPLSVADSAVHEMLDKLGVKPTSKILYEKIRHPETNRMTSILNGTKFLYIEPLSDERVLPRLHTCAGLQCKIFHFGQPKKASNPLCKKLLENRTQSNTMYF